MFHFTDDEQLKNSKNCILYILRLVPVGGKRPPPGAVFNFFMAEISRDSSLTKPRETSTLSSSCNTNHVSRMGAKRLPLKSSSILYIVQLLRA